MTSKASVKANDPYLKPVIFGGLLIVFLSIIFSPGIFLWALVAGFVTVRLAGKIIKGAVSVFDGILLGLFSGLVGAALLDIFLVISFSSYDSQRTLAGLIEKNWPSEIPALPNLAELIPSLLIITALLVFLISSVFAVFGALIAVIFTGKTKTSS